MTLLQTLAKHYAEITPDHIPAPVMAKARLKLLDYLSVYIVGYHRGELTRSALAYADDRCTKDDVTILRHRSKTDVETATLVSALIAHSVELDDGHRYGTAHPAVVVIPPVLAIAEREGLSLEKVLVAICVGYDWMLRTARAMNPSHLDRGFHTTSTTGTIGSAAAVSILLGFDAHQMENAVAISALLSGGLQEMLHDNPSIKSFQVGRSSQSGVLAADMVQRGARGPCTIFEGQHGWFRAMSDDFRPKNLVSDLGTRWEILNTYTKLYPTCRHCHPAIDLALEFFEDKLLPDCIDTIRIRTYTVAIKEVGSDSLPKNMEEAMFSLRYAVAVALLTGSATTETFRGFLNDDRTHELAARLQIETSDERDRDYPQSRGCDLEIQCTDGTRLLKQTQLPKGEPETPLTRKELERKCIAIASPFQGSSAVEHLCREILEFDPGKPLFPTLEELLAQ